MPSRKKTNQISVLVVESNADDSAHIKKCLTESERGEFQIESHETLRAALDRFKKWRGDVVIAALRLQDSAGIDTFKKIEAEAPRFIPIIVLSKSEDEGEALEAVRLGAQDYLVKGVLNRNNLSRVIQYAIQRKKSEEEVFVAQEKYRTIFENSAVAIILTDQKERVVSWNRATEKMAGMTHKDLYLKKLNVLFPPDEWEKISRESAGGNGVHGHFETKIAQKDGDKVDVDISMSILKDADGQITGCIVIMQDITERKNLDHVKDEFISTVSHELRTPMTIVREGICQVYEGLLGPTTQDQNQILSISLESVDRLARMINDLLDISRLEAGKMQLHKSVINVVDVARGVQAAFSNRAREKGIDVLVIPENGSVKVAADRDKIIQIFTNLVGNAFKFTEKGKIEIVIEDRKEEVRCSVTDTGKGLSENQIDKIFDKFQQFGREVGPGEKGAGLGLSICKKLMELHGGKIWATSRIGKGSSFFFTIPKDTMEKGE